jgi:hypothetical protein
VEELVDAHRAPNRRRQITQLIADGTGRSQEQVSVSAAAVVVAGAVTAALGVARLVDYVVNG